MEHMRIYFKVGDTVFQPAASASAMPVKKPPPEASSVWLAAGDADTAAAGVVAEVAAGCGSARDPDGSNRYR